MSLPPLCPAPAAWRICQIAPEQNRLVLDLEPQRVAVACPVCTTPSWDVHSRSRRPPWDVPWGRWPVRLVVQARRFFSVVRDCPRRIFTEPFPGILARYTRQTERLRQVLLELAHTRSAEMAARVAGWLGYPASPDTLLRRQRAAAFVLPAPRVLGVDEFWLRRGMTSGMLLVDLERRQPVAVLEERTAEPLLKWLRAYPSVAILVRDRAKADALAGRVAYPSIVQVADRFHLVRNVGDALKALLHSRHWHQASPGLEPPEGQQADVLPIRLPTDTQRAGRPATPRTRALWEAVQQRRGSEQYLRQIAWELGMDRRTVCKDLRLDQPPRYAPRRPRPTRLPPLGLISRSAGAKGATLPASSIGSWSNRAIGALRVRCGCWSSLGGRPRLPPPRVLPRWRDESSTRPPD